jgi:hypothetical protein
MQDKYMKAKVTVKDFQCFDLHQFPNSLDPLAVYTRDHEIKKFELIGCRKKQGKMLDVEVDIFDLAGRDSDICMPN